ncbi:MAG: type I polyketide synthase [Verrucomicrobiota bacterium]
MTDVGTQNLIEGIAIIGMAGRFPGAKSIPEFWRNLVGGVESISNFTDDELQASGIDSELLKDSTYVKARSVLEDVDLFDAGFFGFTAREAENTDPQHRIFLECAWQALENAGYVPENYRGAIGVYAGSSLNTYLLANLCSNRKFIEDLVNAFQVEGYQLLVGNDKDYLATRVSYKLNLKGPSMSVQTACSTSLVAVCQACQSLLGYQCDMALAGGVSISFPQKRGYRYQEGAIASADGHCRAFDANAQGTVFGSGVGIVVLKRLSDALEDGDTVYAVIKGSAVNNDGSSKVSYMAPSVDGQAEVITLAHALAGVSADTISYVETHGTGTPLGDPIEIVGLTQAFRSTTTAKGFCAIGSLKPNVGHLEAAAGVTGLIKTALALTHKLIPPSLHYERPNPKIDFENSPFYVNTKLTEWKAGATPRRAGVSSFGVGGTNAHAILEEAPDEEPSLQSRPAQLLLLSARTISALDAATRNLADHLKQNPNINLADVAFTLQRGRRVFEQRRSVVCQDIDDARTALEKLDSKRAFSQAATHSEPPIVFMFPGQGAQYVNMGSELYHAEPVFREQVDLCSKLLEPILGLDLRTILYPLEENEEEARRQLTQTFVTQPALFVMEYALAKLWVSWGVRPQAVIGHSVGEYVAACLAGVFALDDALRLVAARARMIQELPSGSMFAVRLAETDLRPLLGEHLSLAAVNAQSNCVVSGPDESADRLHQQLSERNIACRRLCTSHAFHSEMMDSILVPFTELVRQVKLNSPEIPIISTLTGTWAQPADLTDPDYWARQLRQTVRFADGLGELVKEPARILLEVGPGQTLSTLARQHPDKNSEQLALHSMPQSQNQEEVAAMLSALGRLWLAGSRIDWAGFYAHERRKRLPLPTYPFERQRYWVEPPGRSQVESPATTRKVESMSCGAPSAVVAKSANGSKFIGRLLHDESIPDAGLSAGSATEMDQPISHGALLEKIMEEQLRLMSQQLEMLRPGQPGTPD